VKKIQAQFTEQSKCPDIVIEHIEGIPKNIAQIDLDFFKRGNSRFPEILLFPTFYRKNNTVLFVDELISNQGIVFRRYHPVIRNLTALQ